jgi:hypothetical protein
MIEGNLELQNVYNTLDITDEVKFMPIDEVIDVLVKYKKKFEDEGCDSIDFDITDGVDEWPATIEINTTRMETLIECSRRNDERLRQMSIEKARRKAQYDELKKEFDND